MICQDDDFTLRHERQIAMQIGLKFTNCGSDHRLIIRPSTPAVNSAPCLLFKPFPAQ